MNKTHHELCDENIQLREQLDAAQASTNLARLATRQAIAKAEELEREHDALAAQGKRLIALAKLVDKHAIEYGCTEELFDRIEKLGVAAIETPETSLTRLIVGKQAEALEQATNDLYDKLGLSSEQIGFLARRAEQLRRQAEGGAK